MQLSTGNESGAILPQAKKCRLNAVVRAAAFRRKRRQWRECGFAEGEEALL
jgi:hypothetical protein